MLCDDRLRFMNPVVALHLVGGGEGDSEGQSMKVKWRSEIKWVENNGCHYTSSEYGNTDELRMKHKEQFTRFAF